MSTRAVKIALGPGQGTISVDGTDLSRVIREFTLSGQAGCYPELTLHLRIDDASALAEAQVCIPADVAAALVTLGWTPPTGQEVTS